MDIFFQTLLRWLRSLWLWVSFSQVIQQFAVQPLTCQSLGLALVANKHMINLNNHFAYDCLFQVYRHNWKSFCFPLTNWIHHRFLQNSWNCTCQDLGTWVCDNRATDSETFSVFFPGFVISMIYLKASRPLKKQAHSHCLTVLPGSCPSPGLWKLQTNCSLPSR